jgi:hypothetical protein
MNKDEDKEDELNRRPHHSKSSIVQFAAFVGAVTVQLYVLGGMLAWRGGDLLTAPIGALLFMLAALGCLGAIYGIAAASAFLVFRWFFNLDG